ncbi:YrhK family protein [Rhizobium sp. L1K21]|uniref:YrhK family protein n=1 Tax=Rhizobium sp. L1K21 TaxID=2954933 RepID=UPI002093A8C8|nr:YrhK family protein [Rhizobium sp. L1K21]MCO6185848.1 YrhK family protein [Rhizobium sp. L1K21]
MLFTDANIATRSKRHKRIYAYYELLYTLIDVLAAVLFIIGSIMFFFSDWQFAGTWCFLVGSVFFACKPTLRIVREIHLMRLGDFDDLAERF